MKKTASKFAFRKWVNVYRYYAAGLKWNLDDDEISFGRFISTSNQLAGMPSEEEGQGGGGGGVGVSSGENASAGVCCGEVVITTDKPLVWTTDVSRLRDWRPTRRTAT